MTLDADDDLSWLNQLQKSGEIMAEKNYVVYHLHTEDSLLDSCTNHKLYTDKAVELGQTAIAFTEHGNTYGWIAKKMYDNCL